MPVRPSARSVRSAAAARFGAELDRAMRARGVGRRRLADHLGMQSASIIAWWRAGNGLPRLDSATSLAAALDCPRLEEIVRSVVELPCDTCGTLFVHEGCGPRRYCTERCRDLKAKIRAGRTTVYRADRAERALRDHRAAVAAFCRGCEPEGRCRDADCSLRPVSPLPLFSARRGEPDPVMASPSARPSTLGRRTRRAERAAS